MSIHWCQNTVLENWLLLNDEIVLSILRNLEYKILHSNSPIEWEFTKFVAYWCKSRLRSKVVQTIVTNTRQEIQELINLWRSSSDDKKVSKDLIEECVLQMREDIVQILQTEILALYANLTWEDKEFLDTILQDDKIDKVVTLGILLLLDNVKNNISDKKAQWISKAFDYIRKISRNIKKINTQIKAKSEWKKRMKKIIFDEFTRMYQETFATIAAIGCHIYSEDCSVIMQPIKVKYKGAWKIDIKNKIDNTLALIKKGSESQWWEFFPWLEKFLENPNNHNKLVNGKYLYVPLVVDAKDILLYLHIMCGFFDAWSHNNLSWAGFRIFKSTPSEAKNKNTQPRVKFCYSPKKNSDEFNIRLDYTWSTVEIDIGWVDLHLLNWWNILNYLEEQVIRPIIANSYAMGANTNTERVINNWKLRLEEQMALMHSVMMQQGCEVLGREENKTFWYHYTLINDVWELEFQELQAMF